MSSKKTYLNVSVSRAGRRESRITKAKPSQSFILMYETCITLLRSGTFLSAQCKKDCARAALDLTFRTVHEILQQKPRELFPEEEEDADKRLAHSFVSALLLLLFNSALSVLGRGGHLDATLRELFREENDQYRRMALLAWHTHLGGTSGNQLLDEFIDSKPSYPCLLTLMISFLLQYMSNSILEGSKDRWTRSLLKKTYEAIANRVDHRPAGRKDTTQAVDAMLKEADTKAARPKGK